MKSVYPELALERILIALERDVFDATDEEILAAARELGMNPSMKGSAALFGVTKLTRHSRLTEATREQIRSWLETLTPQQAKALRARFGIDH
jgi:hypothetical protein